MKEIKAALSFKKHWKRLEKKHFSYDEMDTVLKLLEQGQTLPGKYHDHALSGNLLGFRECHIHENWLLIYQSDTNYITLIATGSHDDLFK